MVEAATLPTGVFGVLLGLIVVFLVLFIVFLVLWWRKLAFRYTQEELEAEITQRLERQRSVVMGEIGEQLAPHLGAFLEKYEAADARFLGGKPVDYIIYKGYSRVKDTEEPIEGVVFLEVKTSKRHKRPLDRNEAKIKEAVDARRVWHDVITIHLDEREGA